MDDLIKKISPLIQQSEFYKSEKYLCATKLSDYPILNKSDVVKNYKKIICKSKKTIFTQTSGSSGIPLKIAWEHNEYLKSMMSLWRLRNKAGITSKDFYLTCHIWTSLKGNIVDEPVVIFDNSISLSKKYYSQEIMEYYVSQIKIFKPKWIHAQPSLIYLLGNYFSKYAPELLNTFSYIEVVGELLLPEIEKSIKEMFKNSLVVNLYGMQEFNGIMYGQSNAMSVLYDNVVVEIINDHGEGCKEGEEGNIVVTGLKNSIFPLIRYNTEDRGVFNFVNGKKTYTITKGRSNDSLQYNGKKYDGSIFFLVISEYNKTYNPSIDKFQVIYDGKILIFNVLSYGEINMSEMEIGYALKAILLKFSDIKIPIVVKKAEETSFLINSDKQKYFINLKI